jgi:hypothetical protein
MEVRPKWTEEELDIIFSKGKVSTVLSSPEYRIDDFGNIIARSAYGNTNISVGWEVDHIKPVSEGGSNSIDNLRPLSVFKNRSRNN